MQRQLSLLLLTVIMIRVPIAHCLLKLELQGIKPLTAAKICFNKGKR